MQLKMNFTEWGKEFPVTNSIPKILYSFVHKFRKLRSFIRALHSILFLYEDSSIIVLPVASLQTKSSIQQIQEFIDTQANPPPSILFYENAKSRVVDVISISTSQLEENENISKVRNANQNSSVSDSSLPVFLVYRENFTFDIIRTTNDRSIQLKSNEPMTIHDSFLRKVFINNNMITILTQREGEINMTVYSAVYQSNHQISPWAMQCEVDIIPKLVYTFASTLYILKKDGIYGCALDRKGYRRFPQPLRPIYICANLMPVMSIGGLCVFNLETAEVLQVNGKTIRKVCKIPANNKNNTNINISNINSNMNNCNIVNNNSHINNIDNTNVNINNSNVNIDNLNGNINNSNGNINNSNVNINNSNVNIDNLNVNIDNSKENNNCNNVNLSINDNKTNANESNIDGLNNYINGMKILSVIFCGSRTIALTEKSIEIFDILTDECVQRIHVERCTVFPNINNNNTNNNNNNNNNAQALISSWLVSIDRSFGLVFVPFAVFPDDNICLKKNYALPMSEIAPLINLYANGRCELLEQMEKVEKAVGTVAAPILLLSNRSTFLAANLLAERIAKEVERPAANGSIQANVRPTIERLNELLRKRPNGI